MLTVESPVVRESSHVRLDAPHKATDDDGGDNATEPCPVRDRIIYIIYIIYLKPKLVTQAIGTLEDTRQILVPTV